MERLLVFGGTFNPIHLGHAYLWHHFADTLHINRVLLIPTKIPPHKHPTELASGEERMQMCRLAAQNDARVEVSCRELRRAGVSYTVDTLSELHRQYPQAQLFLAVGSDMFFTLEQWRCPHEILRLATICTLARHPKEYEALLQKKQQLEERYGAKIVLDHSKAFEISSTELREKIKKGEDILPFVAPAVAQYINENGLYQNDEL